MPRIMKGALERGCVAAGCIFGPDRFMVDVDGGKGYVEFDTGKVHFCYE